MSDPPVDDDPRRPLFGVVRTPASGRPAVLATFTEHGAAAVCAWALSSSAAEGVRYAVVPIEEQEGGCTCRAS